MAASPDAGSAAHVITAILTQRATAAPRRSGQGAADARLHEVRDAVPRRADAWTARGVPAGLLCRTSARLVRRLAATPSWRSGAARRSREERYAALLLTGDRRYRDYQTLDALPLYEELIVTGAWWDFVDAIASTAHRRAAEALSGPDAQDDARVEPSTDMWKRRSVDHVSADVQGRHRPRHCSTTASSRTSTTRSSSSARPSAGRCASTRGPMPPEVQRYVARNRTRLSALSTREALKNVG